jgi:hypothetical protein
MVIWGPLSGPQMKGQSIDFDWEEGGRDRNQELQWMHEKAWRERDENEDAPIV